METKRICGVLIGDMMLSAQAQEMSSFHDSTEEKINPLMMFYDRGRSNKENNKTHLSTDGQTGQNRRKFEKMEYIIPSVSENNSSLTTRELPATAESILSRGYLKLDPDEFEIIAGESRLNGSFQLRVLKNAVKDYQKLQKKDEKIEKLKSLEILTNQYLQVKQESLQNEFKKDSFDFEEIERARRRIDVCRLLLSGIQVERLILNNQMLSWFRRLLTQDIHLQFENSFSYQSYFAMTHRNDELESIFRDHQREVFQEEQRKNFSAIYQIDKLLQTALTVPIIKEEGQIYQVRFDQEKKLFDEQWIRVSDSELEKVLGDEEKIERSMINAALGKEMPNSGWKLCFPDFLQQINTQEALLENNQFISQERAAELAEQGALYFRKKELVSVEQEIDFEQANLQQIMANVHLVSFLLGEPVDLKSIAYVKVHDGNWLGYLTYENLSLPHSVIKANEIALLKQEKEKIVGQSLEMPALIDEKTGEAVLKLDEQKITEALTEAELVSDEINAVKKRLMKLQAYIHQLKEEKKLIANWNEETYRLLKEDKNSCLARVLQIREAKKEEFKKILAQKIEYLTALASPNRIEQQELLEVNQQLNSLIEINGQIQKTDDGIEGWMLFPESASSSIESKDSSFSLNKTFATVGNTVKKTFFYLLQEGQKQGDFLKGFKQEKTRPLALQAFLEQANAAHIHASQKEYLRQLALEKFQKKLVSGIAVDEERPLWNKIISQLIEEKHAWTSAINAYKIEQESNRKYFFGTSREVNLQIAENKKEIADGHFLWMRLHEAENVAGRIRKEISEVTFAKSNELLWGKWLKQLGKVQGYWSSLFSKIALISNKPLLDEWQLYFEIKPKKQHNYTHFYDYWLKACQKTYFTKHALQRNLFDDAYTYETNRTAIFNDLIKDYHAFKEMVPLNLKQIWESQMKEIAYQKQTTFLYKFWISLKENAYNIKFVQSEINKITNSPNALGSHEELEALASLWKSLIDLNKAKKTCHNCLVKELKKLRELDPQRFDLFFKQGFDSGDSYGRYLNFQLKIEDAKALSVIAFSTLNSLEQQCPESSFQNGENSNELLTRIFHPSLLRKPGSLMDTALGLNCFSDSMDSYSLRHNSAPALPHQPSQLSRHESDEIFGLKQQETAVKQLQEAQKFFGELIKFQQATYEENWKPTFYLGSFSVNMPAGSYELLVDVKNRFCSAMERYQSEDVLYELLGEILGDHRYSEGDQWTSDLRKIIEDKVKIDLALKKLVASKTQK